VFSSGSATNANSRELPDEMIVNKEIDTMADTRNNRNSGNRSRPMRQRHSRRKICTFCADKIDTIDFKDVARLRKFISERGKILPKRMTGNCARHQRELTIAIKRARHIALLPFSGD
jgi:small subunit ribosomal protein S18